jgi:hypothetical protein
VDKTKTQVEQSAAKVVSDITAEKLQTAPEPQKGPEFHDIQHELTLKKFLDSSSGTLYFVPFKPRQPRVIVRHFDSQLPVSLIPSFVSLTSAAQSWLMEHPPLNSLVRVIQPQEVGHDFVAREHFTYYTSTESYELDEEPLPEQPGELAVMRASFRNACGATSSSMMIVETVLARSLLEPTGKTFFHEGERCFIVVELKPTREELEKWAEIDHP